MYLWEGSKRTGKYKLLSSRRSTGQREVGDAGTRGGEQSGHVHVCGKEKTRQEKGKALEKQKRKGARLKKFEKLLPVLFGRQTVLNPQSFS